MEIMGYKETKEDNKKNQTLKTTNMRRWTKCYLFMEEKRKKDWEMRKESEEVREDGWDGD